MKARYGLEHASGVVAYAVGYFCAVRSYHTRPASMLLGKWRSPKMPKSGELGLLLSTSARADICSGVNTTVPSSILERQGKYAHGERAYQKSGHDPLVSIIALAK